MSVFARILFQLCVEPKLIQAKAAKGVIIAKILKEMCIRFHAFFNCKFLIYTKCDSNCPIMITRSSRRMPYNKKIIAAKRLNCQKLTGDTTLPAFSDCNHWAINLIPKKNCAKKPRPNTQYFCTNSIALQNNTKKIYAKHQISKSHHLTEEGDGSFR